MLLWHLSLAGACNGSSGKGEDSMRILAVVSLLGGCLGAGAGGNFDDTGSDTGPEIRLAPEIGTGDHTAGSVEIVLMVDDSDLNQPTGLAFASDNPANLWIVNMRDDSWTIVEQVGTQYQDVQRDWDDS